MYIYIIYMYMYIYYNYIYICHERYYLAADIGRRVSVDVL